MSELFRTEIPRRAESFIPASFFLRRIDGLPGRWISGLQAFIRGESKMTHAGLILDDQEYIEAEPHGAAIKPLETLMRHEGHILLSDAPIRLWLNGLVFPEVVGARERAENVKRVQVCEAARLLDGVPYSFLDYLAIAAVEFDWPGAKLLLNRVEDSQHLICSALVDRVFSWAGISLFDDHPYKWDRNKTRVPGDVTPWDLEQYVMRAQAEYMARLERGEPT